MRKQVLAAALGAALSTLVAVSAASAAQTAAFRCESQMTATKTHPLVFHCDARTAQGAAQIRPSDCDPATMSWGSMQAHCKVANTAAQTGTPVTGG
jgi:hypothetical protein